MNITELMFNRQSRARRTSTPPCTNVVRLVIPARGPAPLRRQPAPVIPLRPGPDVGEWREVALSLVGIALMFVVALAAPVIGVRFGMILVSAPFLAGPWW